MNFWRCLEDKVFIPREPMPLRSSFPRRQIARTHLKLSLTTSQPRIKPSRPNLFLQDLDVVVPLGVWLFGLVLE